MNPPVRRGQIWWADLGEPSGSEPGFTRPVVVISSDRLNASRLATTTVVIVTSRMHHASAPGNVIIPAGLLPRPSVISVASIATVDRRQLVEYVAELPAIERHALDQGLRLALDV